MTNTLPINHVRGTLIECLADMVARFKLPANLASYAAPYATKRPDGLAYPQSTGTVDERRVLYALVRATQPLHAVEIGVHWGVSTIQLLSALRDNKRGNLNAVDIRQTIEGGRLPGSLIPLGLRQRLTLHIGMAGEDYFSPDKPKINFLFEDASHQYDSTKAIHEAARLQLAKGALVVAHDPISRPVILKAIADCWITATVYQINGSGNGLAIWQNL
jgi:predicted O-methyltransferase YrrM